MAIVDNIAYKSHTWHEINREWYCF